MDNKRADKKFILIGGKELSIEPNQRVSKNKKLDLLNKFDANEIVIVTEYTFKRRTWEDGVDGRVEEFVQYNLVDGELSLTNKFSKVMY